MSDNYDNLQKPISRLHVALINTADQGGGAHVVVNAMHTKLHEYAISSDLIVREKTTDLDDVWSLDKPTDVPKLIKQILRLLPRGLGLIKLLKDIQRPWTLWDWFRGKEPMHFPNSHTILKKLNKTPDIIHTHNLHGEYFDLALLSKMSNETPLLMTMHDFWLMTGHCAYPITCRRWKSGCGSCPSLDLYPAVRRDRTKANWSHKKQIYSKSNIYLAVPAQHMLDAVRKSMLWNGVKHARVINNGVDTDLFNPSTELKKDIRARLGLPTDGPILLAAANAIKINKFKDFTTIKSAFNLLRKDFPTLTLVVTGSPPAENGENEDGILWVPFVKSREAMANYYRACDIFLHAAKTEAWGLTATEAMACGIPVVATGIEGLLEQVRSLDYEGKADFESWTIEKATGILTPERAPKAMAEACRFLLTQPGIYTQLSSNAHKRVFEAFTLKQQLANYVDYYEYIINDNKG